jgi:acetoacetyl-CoA synthetase
MTAPSRPAEAAGPAARLLWSPSPERCERATLTRFARAFDLPTDYERLWQWSVDDLDGFWGRVWEFFGVEAETPYERVLGRREMPGTEWFPGARLSFAQHVFRGKDPDTVAIAHASELRPLGEWTWGELRERTTAIAHGLRALGIGPGDRVAAYMPNIPETIAAFLATASIGAVWSSSAPEFGARAVADRFAQIEPKVLLAVDGYRYGGRDFDRGAEVDAIAREIPSLEHVVRLGYLDGSGWQDGFERPGGELTFEQLPFDHPLWVLYSSGTTGLPKAIVHGHGGILLEHLKTMHLHLDAQADDRVLWFTTTGWMMWNFLVGVLLTDASIVLYDGNPVSPDPGLLWDLAADTGTTCFGGSPSFIATCMNAGLDPAKGRDLGRIRSVGCSGSPLPPEGFAWIYDRLGEDTWLFSMSGGTDVCTAFVGGVPTLPVYEGEMQARSLGAKVEAYDDAGRPLIGEVGELVLTEPLPSMPVFFWGDPGGDRLRESYYAMYPGVWRHGDWIEITPRGTAVITGRSDSTINRAGVRIGTSEIYRAVLADEDVVDALVVDVPRAGRENWMPMFVVLRDGVTLDDELVARLKRRVRDECSPRHVPNDVRATTGVPRTLSGKVLEVPVKRILMGADPAVVVSRDSLANPAALDLFVELASEGGYG